MPEHASRDDRPITDFRVPADPDATTDGVSVPEPSPRQEHIVLHRETAPPPGRAELPIIRGYDVEGILGRGGMGVVYQARQQGLNRRVALKMIVAGRHSTPETLARFRAEAESGKPRGVLAQASAADQLAVSPDGKALAVGNKGGWPGDGEGLRLWDLTTAKPIGPFHPLAGRWSTRQVNFMDQGRSVLVAGVGATRLRVFDRETGRPSAAALPPSDIISNFWGNNTATRSRDAVFAFRSSAGTIEQWDAAAGHAVVEPMVHPCAALRMQYSPDGRLLATVCADNSVRLWDSATGLPLGPPLLHVAPVRSLCFAPAADAKGRAGGVNPLSPSEAYHLVTASAAGDIHDWHLSAAFPDDPERLTLWIEAAAGCKKGRTETALLDAATWRERCRQLKERWPEAAAALARQRINHQSVQAPWLA